MFWFIMSIFGNYIIFSCIQNKIPYIFFMNYRFFVFIKLILLFIALGLASFLAFWDQGSHITPDQKIVFVLDINKTMNTQDVLSGTQKISRLQAAKLLIQKTLLSDTSFSYGLILFNASADYIIPPTFDTWTFLLYLSGVTTNLLPQWAKDMSQLTWFLRDKYTSYIILSDFDASQHTSRVVLSQWVALLWLWTLAGDSVRYSNGIVYYDSGTSVFSSRNDVFAQSLGLHYTATSHIDGVSLHTLLFHGINLPLSQRILLYVVLWILVILVVLL